MTWESMSQHWGKGVNYKIIHGLLSTTAHTIFMCLYNHRGKTKYITKVYSAYSQGGRDKEFLFSLRLTIQNFYNKHNFYSQEKMHMILEKRGYHWLYLPFTIKKEQTRYCRTTLSLKKWRLQIIYKGPFKKPRKKILPKIPSFYCSNLNTYCIVGACVCGGGGGGHIYTINLFKWYWALRPSSETSFFLLLHLTFLRSFRVAVQTSSSLPHTEHHPFTYPFPPWMDTQVPPTPTTANNGQRNHMRTTLGHRFKWPNLWYHQTTLQDQTPSSALGKCVFSFLVSETDHTNRPRQ